MMPIEEIGELMWEAIKRELKTKGLGSGLATGVNIEEGELKGKTVWLTIVAAPQGEPPPTLPWGKP